MSYFIWKMSTGKAKVGKLTFKGDKSKIISSTKRKRKDDDESSTYVARPLDNDEHDTEIRIIPGSGRITSSSTTVSGIDTKFMDELSCGDAIIITHPSTLQQETKIVKMVLSNVSMGISTPFSTDLISTTSFSYIKVPKNNETMEADKNKMTQKKHEEEVQAFGTYASEGGEKFVARVKKSGAFGSYKIVTESTSEKLSREELLNKRSKVKSDR